MTAYLDRRFRSVGRIKRSAGTEHKATIRALNDMLTVLFTTGKLDVLREIRDHHYTPLQVYSYYRIGRLEDLPTAATLAPLKESMEKWIEKKECSEAHRRSLEQSLRHLSGSQSGLTVASIPEALSRLRTKFQGKHPRSFNLARAAAQAFVKSTLKRSHPLYIAITDIEPLTVTPSRRSHPLSVEQLALLPKKLKAGHARNARAMALTGMGPSEYWGRWNILPDRIHVSGTKREGRNRDIPKIEPVPVPYATPKAFAEALKHIQGWTVTPYDFRRTYANLLETAGIPRTRRRLYLGHGKRDVTDLYERHEVAAFLVEDAERLRKLVGATESAELKLVGKT